MSAQSSNTSGGQLSDLYYDTCGYVDRDGSLIYPEVDLSLYDDRGMRILDDWR